MRIAIISDIHGNQVALEAVLEDLAQQPKVDHLVIAGDLCLNGPCPREVLETVQRLDCPVIQGNVDAEVVTAAPDKGEKKRSTATWTREQIGPLGIQYLASLPFSHRIPNPDGTDLLIVHANPLNLEDQLYPTLSEEQLKPYLDASDAPVLTFGHLHIPYVRPVAGVLLIDVSSVGHPKDLDRRAAYTVIEWDGEERSVTQVRVPYDIDRTVEALRRSDMPHAAEEADDLLRASY